MKERQRAQREKESGKEVREYRSWRAKGEGKAKSTKRDRERVGWKWGNTKVEEQSYWTACLMSGTWGTIFRDMNTKGNEQKIAKESNTSVPPPTTTTHTHTYIHASHLFSHTPSYHLCTHSPFAPSLPANAITLSRPCNSLPPPPFQYHLSSDDASVAVSLFPGQFAGILFRLRHLVIIFPTIDTEGDCTQCLWWWCCSWWWWR